MTNYFIHHPIPAIVLSIVLTLLGILAAMRLPVAQYPDIAPPTVGVSTTYLGADTSVVNDTVAQVIEEAINGIDGFDYMRSTVDPAGNYNLNVVFKLGTDIDSAAVQVQNKISSVAADLPETVRDSGVTVSRNTPDTTLLFSLNSPKGTYDDIFMRTYADVYFLDKIKRVQGVGLVESYSSPYAMRIWLQPDRMAQLGLTVPDVERAIREQNVRPAVGTFGALPAPRLQEKQYVGQSANRKETKEDFEQIVLQNEGDAFVRLKDVAEVSAGGKDYTYLSYGENLPVSPFGVHLANGANALGTIGEVKQILEEAAQEFPPDMEYAVVEDTTLFIEESLEEVYTTFLEAFLLVLVVVSLFLQDLRATLIALIAIPVSLLATFIAFPVLGFTLNTLTLFAMILAIGLVVDDAIVVIEIVEKKLEQGMEVQAAVLEAMGEVQKPIIAISCVLAAIFLPVTFWGGVTGELYKQFSLTIVISMALSAFIALSLTPALCALLLRSHKEKEPSAFDRFFAKIVDIYKNLLTRLMRWKGCVVAILLLITAGAAYLYHVLPSEYVPKEDMGYFVASVTLPEGTSLNRTNETLQRFSESLRNVQEIENDITISGYDMISDGVSSCGGMLYAILKPWDERARGIEEILEEVNRIAEQEIPEASVFAISDSSLPGLESVGGVSMRLLDVTGHSDEELAEISAEIEAALEDREELDDVESTFSMSKPYVTVKVDEDKAKLLGVNLDDVYSTLRTNFGGDEVNDFTAFGRNYKVVLQADMDYRSEIENMRFMFVKNGAGERIPLDTLVTCQTTVGPSSISRFNGVRSIGFEGNMAEGFSSGEAMDAMEETVNRVAPGAFQLEWTATSRQEKSAQSSAMVIFALSLVFAFLSLVALYESWRLPFAVLLSVPVGVFGALLAEILTENMGSVYMQVGLLILIGLTAKNAILIVEFAKEKTQQGIDPMMAAVSAGVARLRPIWMTSLAFIVACVPLALAEGAGSGARNGMGTAVVGGMLLVTVLGTFLIPILFALFAGRRKGSTPPK